MKNNTLKDKHTTKTATDNVKNMTHAKMRRYAAMAAVAAVLLACGWGIRSCSRYVYAGQVRNYKSLAVLQQRVYSAMVSDMLAQWTKAVTDGTGRRPDGSFSKVDSTDMALQWTRQDFDNNGATKALQVLAAEAGKYYKGAADAPSAFRTEGMALAQAHDMLLRLDSLIADPGNDVIDFAQQATACLDGVGAALERTDFNFFVPVGMVNDCLQRVKAQLGDNKWTGAMAADVPKGQNHRINALKYRRMGFMPLSADNGVLFKVLVQGNGGKPKPDSNVRLNYEGQLLDGTVFDSSYSKGNSVVMKPQQTVTGFNQALTSMPVGSKWQVFIPYDLAYGDRAVGAIPPNSDLVFTIDVIGIE